MANYVKVSSLGGPGVPSAQGDTNYQKLIDKMKLLWQKEIEKVLPDKPDLIVLPECCDEFTGLSCKENIDYYRVRKNQVRDYFAKIAKENNCYITYPAMIYMPDGTLRNSIQIIDREGNVAGIYNKNHVTIGDNENNGTLYGKDANIIKCDFGKIACIICFDLNFDEIRNKYVKQKPDLIIFSSYYHGGLMQNYWAYTCRSFFIGCIMGQQNTIISPVGEVVARSTNYFSHITYSINLDYIVCHLDYNWHKLNEIKKKYGTKVNIFDPGYLGAVLVSSESEGFTAMDLVREFKLELIDEYFQRCRKHRNIPGKIEP